jgi:predicted NBD/HSP70 family sugar kinase
VAGQVTIGIDMGGTKVLGVAVDDEGVVLSEVRVPTPRRRNAGTGGSAVATGDTEGFEIVIEALASVAEQLRDGIEAEVASVGVGAPGLVDNTGVLRPTSPAAAGSTSSVGSRRASVVRGPSSTTTPPARPWRNGPSVPRSESVTR